MTFETPAVPASVVPTAEPAPAPAPAPAEVEAPLEIGPKTSSGYLDEKLSPEEEAYFKSRGEDVAPELTRRFGPSDTDAPLEVSARRPVTPDSAPAVPATAQQPAPAPAPSPTTDPNQYVQENEEISLDDLTVDNAGVMRDGKGRFVPHAALHKARERAKSERTRADDLVRQNSDLMAKYTLLAQRVDTLVAPQPAAQPAPAAPAPEPEDVAPDPEVDIFGYVKWQGRQMAKLQEQLTTKSKAAEEEVGRVREEVTQQNMLTHYRTDAQAFNAQKPEFKDAYRHLIDARHAELALMGYGDPAVRAAHIHREERELVEQAYKQGKRPAEFIYNIAVTRGFRAPVAPPPPPPVVTAAPMLNLGAAPTPPNATPAGLNHAQQLANQAAALAASATLSGSGGPGGDALTAEAIANMSEAEFEATHKRLGKAGMRSFMGGGI